MELRPRHAVRAHGFVLACVACAMLAIPLRAHAEGPIGADGAAITTSDYVIDTTHGALLSSVRATGLAGAYPAIAEGVEGGLVNPASVANRFAGSVDPFDDWLALGITYPLSSGDFFNSGSFLSSRDTSGGQINNKSFYFLNPGAYFQIYGLGVGLNLDVQGVTYSGTSTGTGTSTGPSSKLSLTFVTSHLQAGYRFVDGQIVIGGGLMILRENASGGMLGFGSSLYKEHGFGGEVGVLVRPHGHNWRIGAGLYSKVGTGRLRGTETTTDVVAGSFYLPRYTVRPWQGNLAFVYQFGGRPLNPRYTYVGEHARETLLAIDQREDVARRDHERRMAMLRRTSGIEVAGALATEERDFAELRTMFDAERAAVRKATWRELRERVRTGWPRRYVLLSPALTITGRVSNGVGIESFLLQTVQRSGEKITVTPRVGVESEVWPRRMKVRGGLYVEPTRYATSTARVHATFGFDVRLLRWDVFRLWPEDYQWQVSFAMDVTSHYQSFSFGVGGWY